MGTSYKEFNISVVFGSSFVLDLLNYSILSRRISDTCFHFKPSHLCLCIRGGLPLELIVFTGQSSDCSLSVGKAV